MTGYLALLLAVCLSAVGCGDDDADFSQDDTEVRIESVAVGDLVFDVRIAGPRDGETVFLLHGFPETSYEWRFQLPSLAEAGYRVIAPDQRGYSPGARPEDVSQYQVAFLVLDILRLADAYGAEHFHVVGHDWGAAVAWGLAAVAPERVTTVTSLSIPHPDAFAAELADETSCQYRASSYFDLFVSSGAAGTFLRNDATLLRNIYSGLPGDAEEQYVAVLSQPGALQAALNWYSANVGARDALIPAVGPIRVPTLFVWSDADTAICREGAERTGDFVDASYEFVVLEGVDHWIPERVPDQVTALLLNHFQ